MNTLSICHVILGTYKQYIIIHRSMIVKDYFVIYRLSFGNIKNGVASSRRVAPRAWPDERKSTLFAA